MCCYLCVELCDVIVQAACSVVTECNKRAQYRTLFQSRTEQESPAVADKPARRLRKVRTVYVRAVGL